MKRYPGPILVLVLILASSAAFADDATTLTFDTVATLATEHSAELVKLRRVLQTAQEKLGWQAYKDDLSLSLSGSVSGATFAEMTAGGSASLAAGVDVLPQLTVTGELTAEASTAGEPGASNPVSGSVGVVLSPLADAQGRNRDELAVTSAQIELDAKARAVAFDAVGKLIDAVSANELIALRAGAVSIAQRKLETAQALAERGRATALDTNAAQDGVRNAQQTLLRQQMNAERSLLALSQAIGIPSSGFTLPTWNELALEARVATIAASLSELDQDAHVAENVNVAKATVALRSAHIEQAATHRFTPQVSATANVRLPGPSYSLGLSFKVTPGDWDGTATAEAAQDVSAAETALDATEDSTRYDLRLALLEVTIAQQNLDAAIADLAIANQNMEEANFKFDRGTITEVDVQQARLNLDQAEFDVHAARATLVKAWYTVDLVQF